MQCLLLFLPSETGEKILPGRWGSWENFWCLKEYAWSSRCNTQRLLLTGFGLALGLVFLYLTINNPGDYVDSITGVFDKQYFDKWIEEKLDKKAEFHLIATEFYMLKQVNKVYGSSVGDQMLIQAAQGIQEITGSSQVFRITGNCFLAVAESMAEYETNKQKMEEFFRTPFELNGEKIDFPAVICGIMDGGKRNMKMSFFPILSIWLH